MNNIFNGPSKIFFKAFDAPDNEYKELPMVDGSLNTVVADSLLIVCDDEELDDKIYRLRNPETKNFSLRQQHWRF